MVAVITSARVCFTPSTISAPSKSGRTAPRVVRYTGSKSAGLSLIAQRGLPVRRPSSGVARGSVPRTYASSASASTSMDPPEQPSQVGAGLLEASWKFLRPHTIRGTILGTTAIVSTALMENPEAIKWTLLPRALLGLVALLCGNGYIVGINQIYDEDIDKVNKPFLPVAAGELTHQQAWMLCLAMAVGGVSIVACNFEPLITSLYSFGLFLGTVYSVPPLRLKQNAVAAFMIIACVRGFLLNFGVFHATRAALGFAFKWSPSVMFITCFVTLFATVIAITKDLPDVKGDREGGIETFATRFGERSITFLGSGLLLVNYIGAIAAAAMCKGMFNAPLMIGAHAILGSCLVYQTYVLDSKKYTVEAIQKFYAFIWNLFYSEYFLLPFL